MVEMIEIERCGWSWTVDGPQLDDPTQEVDEWLCAEDDRCCNASRGKGTTIGWWFNDDDEERAGVYWTSVFAPADTPWHLVCEDCATWIEEGRP